MCVYYMPILMTLQHCTEPDSYPVMCNCTPSGLQCSSVGYHVIPHFSPDVHRMLVPYHVICTSKLNRVRVC